MLVDLDSPSGLDPTVVGAKAAWLALGRRAGLPVLPGLVVPAQAALEPFARAAEALADRGSGRARLQVIREPLAPALAAELPRTSTLGSRLVARSSSLLETGGEWAGAFTSYLDLAVGDLPVAVRGCWASAFTVDALERAERIGVVPGTVPMAVLIQPFVAADAGGAARFEDGAVVIVAARGAPAAVLQGWEPGLVCRVNDDGSLHGSTASEALGTGLLTAIAATLRDSRDRTGATAMEWAWVDGRLAILQLDCPRPTAIADLSALPGATTPAARALAHLVARAPGALGERLVLPWAVAAPSLVVELLDREADRAGGGEVEDALGEAEAAADALIAATWRRPATEARAVAATLLGDVRGPEPDSALAALASLDAPDADLAARCIAAIGRARAALASRGLAARPDEAWYVDPAAAAESTGLSPEHGSTRGRFGTGRWEPFIAATAIAAGDRGEGIAAAPGVGGGLVRLVPDPRSASSFRPRAVLVAPRPLPHLAPLLWDASALVTAGGGPGAHLFESARALGIPAVSGVDLEALELDRPALAGRACLGVDGTSGRVWRLAAPSAALPSL